MQQLVLDGAALHRVFEGGYRNLKKNVQTINDLNVFPVPDGDTGTNMVRTFGGGWCTLNAETEHVGDYMKALSRAVLLSARGNSGVIFSQFIHGLYRGLADRRVIRFSDLASAFTCAREDAYKSIVSPAEGTMLTVIREAEDFFCDHSCDYPDFQTGFEALLTQMKATLAKTPELLPVLKEAGVVDSGGAGLVCFVEGICAYLRGEDIEDTPDLADTLSAPAVSASDFGPDSVLEYGYCTEFILQLMNAKTDVAAFSLDAFVTPLQEMGDSIVAVCNDGIVKIHIHSFTPEKLLEYGRRFGEFVNVKIENMSVQHSETQMSHKRESVKYAIVAVASGKGIEEYFYNIGANVVIDGGQTNNPPVEAFLEAFRRFDAEHIVVLPNNGNVVMTAKQAAEMYTQADVRVIPTKSIVEGCSALSMMNLWCDTVEELIDDMSAGLSDVTAAYVTTATRDTQMNGLDVKKDAYIGLSDKELLCVGETNADVAEELIRLITERGRKEVIVVFYGADVDEQAVSSLRERLESRYPAADIGFIDGKQDVYDFIISLE